MRANQVAYRLLCLFVGSRAPLSSKRPLLSLYVSVCLSVVVRCPRPFTHLRLTDLDEIWQLGPTSLKLVALKFYAPAPPSGGTVNEKPHN